MPKIDQGAVEQLPIPLAPLPEQRRIVAKVEALLVLADSLEETVERTRCALSRAPQAILQKAFAGELVATEAELAAAEGRDFESADELLRRESGALGAESAAKPEDAAQRRRSRPRKDVAVGT